MAGDVVASGPGSLTRSPGEVLRLASAENFPVAPRLLPRRERAALLALYAFARTVDDVGDAPGLGDPAARLRLLDDLDADLDRLFRGAPPRLPVVAGLAAPVHAHRLPEQPFRDLVAANRRDQQPTAYRTWDELLSYCALSAAPVGELVLHVFGAASPERLRASAVACAGLQVVEHLQDVAEDAARGRVYLPADELDRAGVAPPDLVEPRDPVALHALVVNVAARVELLLHAGTPLLPALAGRPRLLVAGFLAGGHAALDGVRRAGPALIAGSPGVRRTDLARHLAVLLAGAGGRRGAGRGRR